MRKEKAWFEVLETSRSQRVEICGGLYWGPACASRGMVQENDCAGSEPRGGVFESGGRALGTQPETRSETGVRKIPPAAAEREGYPRRPGKTEEPGRKIKLKFRWGSGQRLTEGNFALGAGAKCAEIIVAEDAGGVTVVEADLDSVVPYLGGRLSSWLWLVHWEERRGQMHAGEGILFGAFVVAGRTGAMIAKEGKVKVAGMAVRPGDIDTGTGFHVDFDGDWLLALINGSGHGNHEFFFELQQSPGGIGLPWGQVVGWPRKLQMR